MMSLYSPADVQVRVAEVATGSRIDAIVNCGGGVILCGTRSGASGRIYKSTDFGQTFALAATISGSPIITALAAGSDGRVYALTGVGALWLSTDAGASWTSLGTVTPAGTPDGGGQWSYGLEVTPANTVLVSDTNPAGGHVFRSTNGGASFSDIGALGARGLYRFKSIEDGVVVVTWGGAVYKSTAASDGASWTLKATLSANPVWVAERMGNSKVLLGTMDGVLYLSEDNCETFAAVASVRDAVDDICSMGDGRAIISTYAGEYLSFFTDNYGRTVRSIGRIGVPGVMNNIDRMCRVDVDGQAIVLGSTILGQIIDIRKA